MVCTQKRKKRDYGRLESGYEYWRLSQPNSEQWRLCRFYNFKGLSEVLLLKSLGRPTEEQTDKSEDIIAVPWRGK